MKQADRTTRRSCAAFQPLVELDPYQPRGLRLRRLIRETGALLEPLLPGGILLLLSQIPPAVAGRDLVRDLDRQREFLLRESLERRVRTLGKEAEPQVPRALHEAEELPHLEVRRGVLRILRQRFQDAFHR